MRGATYLARAFESYGVDHVFVVPTILSHTLVALEERAIVRRIVPHSEKSAVYMADGYARASGRVGVAGAQTVGAANLAAALRDPFLAGSPVLAITGGPTADGRHRNRYQEIEDLPLFKPVTKASGRVDVVERLPDMLRQAFRVATTGRPGPVHLELPGHAGEFLEVAEGDLDDLHESRFGRVPPFRPAADASDVRRLLDLMRAAERPVLVAGGGVRHSGAGAELVRLAESLDVPIVTSMNAKDQVPAGHPLNCGVVGLYSRRSANEVVLDADLVVFVGSNTGSQVTANWKVPRPGVRVAQIDIEPSELGRHYPNEVSLLGDVRTVLEQVLAAVGPEPRRAGGWSERARDLGARWAGEVEGLRASDAVPIRPERLCTELGRLLPDDAIVVSDTGHAGMWTAAWLDLAQPQQGYLRAAGSLGWGLPAAIGAQMAVPDRRVVAFTGDGGLWYHVAEIETAVRWRTPVVIVVNNNQSLNQEVRPFSTAYGGTLHGAHRDLWHFEDVDFVGLASSMGAGARRVDRPGDLASAFDEALASSGPFLLDVRTDIEALAPLAHT